MDIKNMDTSEINGILHFLETKGLTRDGVYFSDKKKKYRFELILPHDDIAHLYLLRCAKSKGFDRWANSTIAQLFFTDLEDLKEVIDSKRHWKDWRMEHVVSVIVRNNQR